MKTLFAALAATVAFAGAAFAQEAPQLIGNYSANVLQEYNGSNGAVAQSNANGLDFTSTAAIRLPQSGGGYGRAAGGYGPTVSGYDVHSGR